MTGVQTCALPISFTIPGTVPTAIPRVRRRRMGGFGCLIGLVFLVAIVAGPVIAIISFVGAADDAIDEVTGIIDDATPPTIDTPEAPAAPPRGLAGASMVSAANFKGALARVDDARFGKATFIRLSPDRAAFQLVKGARQRDATVDYLGAFARGTVTRGPTGATAITLSAIDPAAPARLVRASAKRFGVKEKGIDYLVGSPSTDGGHGWVAYFKNGTYVQGDAKGRVVRRIS